MIMVNLEMEQRMIDLTQRWFRSQIYKLEKQIKPTEADYSPTHVF